MRKAYAAIICFDTAGEYEAFTANLDSMARIGIEAGAARWVLPRLHEFSFPERTTAERDAMSSPRNGTVIFNTDTQTAQIRTLSGWENLNTGV